MSKRVARDAAAHKSTGIMSVAKIATQLHHGRSDNRWHMPMAIIREGNAMNAAEIASCGIVSPTSLSDNGLGMQPGLAVQAAQPGARPSAEGRYGNGVAALGREPHFGEQEPELTMEMWILGAWRGVRRSADRRYAAARLLIGETECLLLVSQRDHRVDIGGAAGGKEAGQQRQPDQHRCRRRVRGSPARRSEC